MYPNSLKFLKRTRVCVNMKVYVSVYTPSLQVKLRWCNFVPFYTIIKIIEITETGVLQTFTTYYELWNQLTETLHSIYCLSSQTLVKSHLRSGTFPASALTSQISRSYQCDLNLTIFIRWQTGTIIFKSLDLLEQVLGLHFQIKFGIWIKIIWCNLFYKV